MSRELIYVASKPDALPELNRFAPILKLRGNVVVSVRIGIDPLFRE